MSRRSNRKLRIKLHEKDPMCYYCGKYTVLSTHKKHAKEVPNLATLEHLRTRFDANRSEPNYTNERRIVLACKKCNQEKAREKELEVGIEELRRRSGYYDRFKEP